MTRPDSREESLSIPTSVRAAVDLRDQEKCRVCGRYLGERRALHHIIYGGDARGMGGRRHHDVDEIITLCWQPGDGDCHAKVHGDKHYWTPILLQLCQQPGLTAFQVIRWRAARERRNARRLSHGSS